LEDGLSFGAGVNELLHYLRGVVPADESAEIPDREYLDRFARDRDESAFAALVGRYCGSVWSVCRRLVDCEHDAEDVFQATFLIFACKAASIRQGDSLPAWLHGVARRIAANLRRDTRRQADTNAAAAHRPRSTTADLTWQEGLAVLDEELARLPERYRAVLIVCCLDGRSRDEAALQLGWSQGQVKGRLERAREMLRRRLERRGFHLATLLLAAAVSGSSRAAGTASAGAPATLVASAIKTALSVGSGLGTAPGVVSSNVARLTEGVLNAMLIQKVKLITAVLLAVAIAITGGGLLTYRLALGTAAAQEDQRGSETPVPVKSPAALPVQDPDKEAAARAAEAARREAEARAAAARAAAAKAAKEKETPTFPTPPNKADIKVDFEEMTFAMKPFALLATRQPESIRVRGDGICEYRIEERPARGEEPKWDAAYLEHKLPLERLRRLEELLKKTDWLTAAGHEGRATHLHPAKYTVTLKRNQETRTITMEGEKDEPYKSLVAFFQGIALQESLLYRLERVPGKEQYAACAEVERYVRAERGERHAKPIFEIDLRRYLPTFRRYVRESFSHSKEELVPALLLLGHFKVEADREHIAALSHDRDMQVRIAVAEALGALGGKESVPVLRRMVRSTNEAAWELVRLGPLAVPTIVEVIESGSERQSAREPDALDHQRLIRAYIDHWAEVPKPIDPRVLEAVRKSMETSKGKAGIEYHKQLLDLASKPAK
jgi:RNA polymerase sigma factor (sigma-70 family)